MALYARFLVRPQRGVFAPASFAELLQSRIVMPGLDPLWRHTLVDVRIADDGSCAELHVMSEAPPAHPVDTALRVIDHTPPARVRFIAADTGDVLHEGEHPAPFRHDQLVQIGDRRYTVTGLDWPLRDVRTGAVPRGEIDWQHVTVTPAADAATLPARAS